MDTIIGTWNTWPQVLRKATRHVCNNAYSRRCTVLYRVCINTIDVLRIRLDINVSVVTLHNFDMGKSIAFHLPILDRLRLGSLELLMPTVRLDISFWRQPGQMQLGVWESAVGSSGPGDESRLSNHCILRIYHGLWWELLKYLLKAKSKAKLLDYLFIAQLFAHARMNFAKCSGDRLHINMKHYGHATYEFTTWFIRKLQWESLRWQSWAHWRK